MGHILAITGLPISPVRKPTTPTPSRTVGCALRGGGRRTKKPRQSGAEFPRGVVGTPALWLMDGLSPTTGSSSPIQGPPGMSSMRATSTAMAMPTSYGRAATARLRCG